MKSGKVVVKNAANLSEKEALAMLQMAAGRRPGTHEPIRLKILDLISKGQNYGSITVQDSNQLPLNPSECKKIVIAINLQFKKTGVSHVVRYVPSKDVFVYVPLEKIDEWFGKS